MKNSWSFLKIWDSEIRSSEFSRQPNKNLKQQIFMTWIGMIEINEQAYMYMYVNKLNSFPK